MHRNVVSRETGPAFEIPNFPRVVENVVTAWFASGLFTFVFPEFLEKEGVRDFL